MSTFASLVLTVEGLSGPDTTEASQEVADWVNSHSSDIRIDPPPQAAARPGDKGALQFLGSLAVSLLSKIGISDLVNGLSTYLESRRTKITIVIHAPGTGETLNFTAENLTRKDLDKAIARLERLVESRKSESKGLDKSGRAKGRASKPEAPKI